MARRTRLAVARAQPLRPALRLPLVSLPSRRALAWVAAGLAVVALAYVGARETPLFAVRSIDVTGAPPEVARAVRASLRDVQGVSLVKLDGGAIERRLDALPAVIGAHVDRAFPNTLRVAVEPERPIAVFRSGERVWVVSRRGTVIASVERGAHPELPRVLLPSGAALSPGGAVGEEGSAAALAVLDRVPRDFPVRVKRADVGASGVTLLLRSGTELRLGRPDELGAKMAAADAILRSLSPADRAGLAYLDVSLPERPVGMNKSQVSREG